jgi:hypothetical protein
MVGTSVGPSSIGLHSRPIVVGAAARTSPRRARTAGRARARPPTRPLGVVDNGRRRALLARLEHRATRPSYTTRGATAGTTIVLSSNACSASSMLARCDSGVSRTTASNVSMPTLDTVICVDRRRPRHRKAHHHRRGGANLGVLAATEPSSPSGTTPNDTARSVSLAENVRMMPVPLTGDSDTLEEARDDRVGVGARLGQKIEAVRLVDAGSWSAAPASRRARSWRSA